MKKEKRGRQSPVDRSIPPGMGRFERNFGGHVFERIISTRMRKHSGVNVLVNSKRDQIQKPIEVSKLESLILAQNERWRQA